MSLVSYAAAWVWNKICYKSIVLHPGFQFCMFIIDPAYAQSVANGAQCISFWVYLYRCWYQPRHWRKMMMTLWRLLWSVEQSPLNEEFRTNWTHMRARYQIFNRFAELARLMAMHFEVYTSTETVHLITLPPGSATLCLSRSRADNMALSTRSWASPDGFVSRYFSAFVWLAALWLHRFLQSRQFATKINL